MNNILAIDIGNTNISYAFFKGKKIIKKGKISTQEKYSLKKFASFYFGKIEDVIISSVVPTSLLKLKKELRAKFPKRPLVLGENIKVSLVNLYKKPSQVGQDRLVGAYAGHMLYGGGLLIIDFGTAVTFDLVSFKGEYMGGMIFPGLKTSFNALCQRAALLPKKMRLVKPKELIGRTTEESIRSGLYSGFAGLTANIVHTFRKEYGRRLKVIVTGGDADRIYPLIKDICILEPDLTLIGLKMIYDNRLKIERKNKII
ncbi:MAG: type III pantothenate kinase [Candidatus Omnitrophica bacterium]|nr:type III pantothenate kinase [Candidatus Omnitrophota bacterium]